MPENSAPEGAPARRLADPSVCAMLGQTSPRVPRAAVLFGSLCLMLFAASSAGCAGPLAMDFSSASLGTSGDGTLRHPAVLPFDGDGYAVPAPWRTRHANYGTESLVGAVARAARTVEREAPGGSAAVGDLSHRAGGGSVQP